jgi:hypothetical protein
MAQVTHVEVVAPHPLIAWTLEAAHDLGDGTHVPLVPTHVCARAPVLLAARRHRLRISHIEEENREIE